MFQTHPWIWVWSCLVFWCSLKKTKKKKTFVKTNNTKENQRSPTKASGKPNKVFKCFRSTLGYGFGLVWFFGVPIKKQKKETSGKPTIPKKTKENTKKASGKPTNQSCQRFQTHPWIWVWSCLFLLVFPILKKK